jgi:hypothetical protein
MQRRMPHHKEAWYGLGEFRVISAHPRRGAEATVESQRDRVRPSKRHVLAVPCTGGLQS